MILIPITDILFPNRCEVVELKDQDINVYIIYKNGSSSLYARAVRTASKILINNQIKKLKTIDVIIRNPQDRFISGVNTYVHNIIRDNPHLDLDTVIFFVENYLFLNRHYLPQIGWLSNIRKYTDNKTTFRLRAMSDLTTITQDHIKPPEKFVLSDEVVDRLKLNVNNEMYKKLDSSLFDLIGQELTIDEIFTHLKQKDPIAFQRLIG